MAENNANSVAAADAAASPQVGSTYREALRATSIIGGAEGVTYLIGLIRTKAVALLLGPSGVGLIALYTNYMSYLQTVAGLGIASSGVRQVAEAVGSGDAARIALTVGTLRRACWFTGLLALMLAVAFARPASQWSMGSTETAAAFALLGAAGFLQILSAGQAAVLQGFRRIGDLARMKVYAATATTAIAVGAYYALGKNGILPVLICAAGIQLLVSWIFSRRIHLEKVHLSWSETWWRARELVALGFGFMYAALISVSVTTVLGFLVVRQLGLEANGMYGAAWMLSGLFAGFILGAMGTDFFPRLTAAQADHRRMQQLVNEQTEVGIFLALPGLMGTLAFAPWVIKGFYSSKFLPAADLLPWFVLGVFGQVITWPLGFILMAKGAKGLYALTETLANGARLALSYLLLQAWELKGLAVAVPLGYCFYGAMMLPVVYHITGHLWSRQVAQLLVVSFITVACGFVANRLLPPAAGLVVGVSLTVVACIFCLRGLASRVGMDHKLVRLIASIPGGRLLLWK
jgi:PST family polysaccharide transporter